MTRIVLIPLFLITSIFASAQNFRLGFQASPHISWMNSSINTIVNDESRVGIKYGIEADIFLAGLPRYSFNTGLFVSNHSFKALYNTGISFVINKKVFNDKVEIQYKLNYLEIPLNLKLRSDQFYRLTYYGQFGLTNYINISATATSGDSQLIGDNASDAIGFYNFGLIMGGGAEYDVGGNTALNLGIQYSNVLLDFSTIKALKESSKFHSIRVIIGVMF